MNRLAIIGGGSWGTALAIVLAPRFPEVRLWVHDPALAAQMAITRENTTYLPGLSLPGHVEVVNSLALAMQHADVVLSVMPSAHARELIGQLRPYVTPTMTFVSATKGLERQTWRRMSSVITEELGDVPVAVLAGPGFAREIAGGEPAALVLASEHQRVAAALQEAFAGPSFRVYTNRDPIGTEIGGALKNIIAIAAGVCQGLGLGNNTLAALITRGLAEMTRLAVALGGQPQTLFGLSGLGDLVLTCNGTLSRNRRLGIGLAEGRTLSDLQSGTKMVAEGVESTDAAVALADQAGVDVPIISRMHAVLRGGQHPREAIRELMERSLKTE